MSSKVALYQRLMQRTKHLTEAEEVALGKQMASGDSAAKLRARNILIERHMPLVVHLAEKSNYQYKQSVNDLIQAGMLGLVEAADRWDYLRENRFSTYARWYIQEQVWGQLKLSRPVHIPTIHADRQIKKNIDKLTIKLGRSPADEEVASAYDVSVRTVRAARARTSARKGVSLQQPLSSESASELQDLLQGMELTPEQVALAHDELEAAHKRLDSLFERLNSDRAKFSARNREIFEYFFSIKDGQLYGKKKTLDEVAAFYGISRERVRQIILNVWEKISNRPLGGYENPFQDELDRIEILQEIISRAGG